MGKVFKLLFFLHGLTALISQTIILRTLMSVFWGNELFLTISLGFWLLGTGLGSLLAGRVRIQKSLLGNLLAGNFFLIALGGSLEIFLIKFFRGKFFLTGETPNFLTGLIITFLLLFPFCLLLDALFILAIRFFAPQKKKIAQISSKAYLWETIGFALGGILFNFFLIRINTFLTAFFLSLANLFFASLFAKNLHFRKLLLYLVVPVFLLLSFLSSFLDRETTKLTYPNLLESLNSRYGQIIVTQSSSQYNFFVDGTLVGTSNEPEESEYLIHFIFSLHPQPKKILFLGGGFQGAIAEALKYKEVAKIDYVEMDPLFLETVQKYLPLRLQKALAHPKVTLYYLDGRRFLKQTGERYDLIFFLLPNPSTALLSRFYTQECFAESKKLLEQDGLVVTTLEIPVNYLNSEAENLVANIFWTQKKIFPTVQPFPQETNIVFVSSKRHLETDIYLLKERFQKRKIKTSFFTPKYFSYRINSDYIPRLQAIFLQNRKVNTNQDFFPSGYLYQIAFWQTKFHPLLGKILGQIEKISQESIGVLFLFFFFLINRWRPTVIFVGVGGFTLMVFEILTIFAFQTRLGFLFSKVSLIFTTFLSGMGLGNIWATTYPTFGEKKIKMIAFLLASLSLLSPFLLQRAEDELPFYCLGVLAGILAGAIFPLASHIFLSQKDAREVGILYSADLFGAFGGAVLTSIFFLPILGIRGTFFFLAGINFFFFLSRL